MHDARQGRYERFVDELAQGAVVRLARLLTGEASVTVDGEQISRLRAVPALDGRGLLQLGRQLTADAAAEAASDGLDPLYVSVAHETVATMLTQMLRPVTMPYTFARHADDEDRDGPG